MEMGFQSFFVLVQIDTFSKISDCLWVEASTHSLQNWAGDLLFWREGKLALSVFCFITETFATPALGRCAELQLDAVMFAPELKIPIKANMNVRRSRDGLLLLLPLFSTTQRFCIRVKVAPFAGVPWEFNALDPKTLLWPHVSRSSSGFTLSPRCILWPLFEDSPSLSFSGGCDLERQPFGTLSSDQGGWPSQLMFGVKNTLQTERSDSGFLLWCTKLGQRDIIQRFLKSCG